MVNSSILDGKTNVKIDASAGSVVARGGNYILAANAADIANYAREGADLVIEFADGQRLVLRDFFLNGVGYNNLLLADGEMMQLVDFSAALGGADGISDAVIAYDGVAAAGANAALLGLLGVAAAGAGVAVAAAGGSSSDDNGGKDAGPKEAKTAEEGLEYLTELLNKKGGITDKDHDTAKGYIEVIYKNIINIKDTEGLDATLKEIRHKLNGSGLTGGIDDAINALAVLKTVDLLNGELAKGEKADSAAVKKYIDSICKDMKSIKDINGLDAVLNDLVNKVKGTDYEESVNDIINGTKALRAVDHLNEILLDEKGNFKNAGDIIKAIKAAGDYPAMLENINKGLGVIGHITEPKATNEKVAIFKAIKALNELAIALETIVDSNGDGKIDISDIRASGKYNGLLEDIYNAYDFIKDIEGVDKIGAEIGKKLGLEKGSALDVVDIVCTAEVEAAADAVNEIAKIINGAKSLDEIKDADLAKFKEFSAKVAKGFYGLRGTEEVLAVIKDFIKVVNDGGDLDAVKAAIKTIWKNEAIAAAGDLMKIIDDAKNIDGITDLAKIKAFSAKIAKGEISEADLGKIANIVKAVNADGVTDATIKDAIKAAWKAEADTAKGQLETIIDGAKNIDGITDLAKIKELSARIAKGEISEADLGRIANIVKAVNADNVTGYAIKEAINTFWKAEADTAMGQLEIIIDGAKNIDGITDLAKIKELSAKIAKGIDFVSGNGEHLAHVKDFIKAVNADGATDATIKDAVKTYLNDEAVSDFNKLIEKINGLEGDVIVKENTEIKSILKDFDVNDITNVKGIKIDGIEKEGQGIAAVKKIIEAIDGGESVENIKQVIADVNSTESEFALPESFSDEVMDDLSSDHDDVISLQDLFPASGEVPAFDMAILNPALQDDFAADMVLASQIIV